MCLSRTNALPTFTLHITHIHMWKFRSVESNRFCWILSHERPNIQWLFWRNEHLKLKLLRFSRIHALMVDWHRKLSIQSEIKSIRMLNTIQRRNKMANRIHSGVRGQNRCEHHIERILKTITVWAKHFTSNMLSVNQCFRMVKSIRRERAYVIVCVRVQ